MAKKVAVSGYYGFKNFGDELILSILTERLKSQGADVTVFSVDPEFTAKTYGVKSVKTFDPLAVLKTIKNCDVLISGGGSLFQDATSLKSVIYYAFVLGVAQLLGKKTIIFAQGVGPLRCPFGRLLVKTLFKHANFVSVRDENSFNLMKTWGVDSQLVSDPVYSMKLEATQKENTLGVQLRSFAGMGETFLENLASAVKPNEKLKVFSLQKSLDYDVCKQFAEKTGAQLLEENLIEALGCLETLVSMRFHSLLVALKSGVKCVAINYDPKVQTLAEKYSLPLIEFTDSHEEIRSKINNAVVAQVQSEDFPWENILKFVR